VCDAKVVGLGERVLPWTKKPSKEGVIGVQRNRGGVKYKKGTHGRADAVGPNRLGAVEGWFSVWGSSGYGGGQR